MSNHKLTYQQLQLKQFIRSFNFPDPSWDNLPLDFPGVSTVGLSKAEKGMLTGITLAWYLEKGKHVVYKQCIKVCFTITFIIIAGLYAKFITTTDGLTTVKEVSAATVSAGLQRLNITTESELDELIESTRSGTINLMNKGK